MVDVVTPSTAGRTRINRPKKMAVILAQKIVHDIVNRGLPAGAMLAPEYEMAEELGVGRATLREALRYLELQGVLVIQAGPRGGPMVMAPSPKALASSFALSLEFAAAPFSDVIAARVLLEPVLAAQAATHIDRDQIAALQKVCDDMTSTVDRADHFLDCNVQFHQLVAASSSNTVFEYILSSLSLISDGHTMGINYPIRQRKAVAGAHQRVLDALKAGDPKMAEETMRKHMLEFQAYVTKQYREVLSKTVQWGDHIV